MALTMDRWKRQKAEKKQRRHEALLQLEAEEKQRRDEAQFYTLYCYFGSKLFPEVDEAAADDTGGEYSDEQAATIEAVIVALSPEERATVLEEMRVRDELA